MPFKLENNGIKKRRNPTRNNFYAYLIMYKTLPKRHSNEKGKKWKKSVGQSNKIILVRLKWIPPKHKTLSTFNDPPFCTHLCHTFAFFRLTSLKNIEITTNRAHLKLSCITKHKKRPPRKVIAMKPIKHLSSSATTETQKKLNKISHPSV